jgi:hypothetical protein
MAKTLQELRQDARRAADLTHDSDAVNDLTLNTYINEAFHELYDIIIDADDGRIFAKNAMQLPQLGDFTFLLPTELYRLISCHVLMGSSYVPAVRADPSEYAELADGLSHYAAPRYLLRWDINIGTQFLAIFPAQTTETVAITYFPRPKTLSSDGEFIDLPASWISFISWGAAIKMLTQLERDASAHFIELRRLAQRVEDSVGDLDMNSPAVVRDSTNRNRGGSFA